MGIDRVEASSWSKDRIKEEIADRRQWIWEWRQEIRDTNTKAELLEEEAMEAPYPGAHEKRLDAMSDHVDHLDKVINETTADVEFLKSLL